MVATTQVCATCALNMAEIFHEDEYYHYCCYYVYSYLLMDRTLHDPKYTVYHATIIPRV